MDRHKVVLDTDIGDDIDDAFALSIILKSKELNLLGITTVYKNTLLRSKIAKKELELYGRSDIEVYKGINKPLNQEIIRWPYEELDEDGKIIIRHYFDEMKTCQVNEKSAVDYLIEVLKANPNEVIIIAIGPLTNLASVYLKDPNAFLLIKQIVLMGGQLDGTYPEWNIRVDPEAARLVFNSGVRIKAVGLNVTTKCKVDDDLLTYLRSLKSSGNKLIVDMLEVWLKDNKRQSTMHDGLAVATLIDDFCTFEEFNILVELEGPKRGYTLIVDENTPHASIIEMATAVKTNDFFAFMKERIKD